MKKRTAGFYLSSDKISIDCLDVSKNKRPSKPSLAGLETTSVEQV